MQDRSIQKRLNRIRLDSSAFLCLAVRSVVIGGGVCEKRSGCILIFFAKPDKNGFNEMAVKLARRAGITEEVMSDEEICYEANRFEMRGGGLSGRTAQQFANYLLTVKG